MPTVEKHKPGAFSWIELSTSDQNGARSFYTALFDWTFRDSPMGPDSVYTMFLRNSHKCGAAYTIPGDEKAMGVPPHWNLYIAVADADDTAKRATELGAKVLAAPFDVYSFGRMAVIQDPAGAVFSVWQAKEHAGMGIRDEAGTFCWADLNTPDAGAAGAFYSRLFGWTVEARKDGSDYEHIKNGDDYIGGIPKATLPPGVPPHWLIYILVTDCKSSTEKAKQLGAQVHMDTVTMEKVGRLSVVMDPQGAALALFELLPH